MSGISALGMLDPQQVSAISRLQQIGRDLAQSSLRLSTQKRINSAADDPAGLVAAARLQNELDTLQTTTAGLTQAASLLNTADTNAGQILQQLQAARAAAFAVAGGTLSAQEIAAQQTIVDNAVRGIDTSAASSFNGRRLLDGSSGYTTSGVDNAKIKNISVLDRRTSSPVTVTVNVTSQATRAANSYTGGTLAGAATVAVTGPSGTTSISLASGATTTDIETAFNNVTYLTGVTATRIDANQVNFATTDYGTAATMSIAATSGTFAMTTSGTTAGTNAVATINGLSVTGAGSTFTATAGQTSLLIAVDPTVSGAIAPFVVSGAGLKFVLGSNISNTAQIGLQDLTSAGLRGLNGVVSSVVSGGANSLTSGNSTNAIRVLDDAISQVTLAQSNLGSFQKYTLGAASNVAAATSTNVSSALDSVQGADVAVETALLARNQLLQQGTYAALQIFNQQQQSVIGLLNGAATFALRF